MLFYQGYGIVEATGRAGLKHRRTALRAGFFSASSGPTEVTCRAVLMRFRHDFCAFPSYPIASSKRLH